MKSREIQIKAPSNIALIKYMGKLDGSVKNLPTNPSLSMTLSDLCTLLKLEALEFDRDFEKLHLEWKLGGTLKLNDQGQERFRQHAIRVMRLAESEKKSMGWRFPTKILLQSENTFPAATGIASSASSFAALTMGVLLASAQDPNEIQILWKTDPEFRRWVTRLSRQGSGSSCRSLEGPWVAWEGENAFPIVSKLPPMVDLVLVVGREPKKVGSSEAHLRVKTSPLWNGRTERATARFHQMKEAIQEGRFNEMAQIAWEETWEMHSLFHTSQPPFTYWLPETVAVLRFFEGIIGEAQATQAVPIVTMDAGPNIHVLVPADQKASWYDRIHVQFPNAEILTSPEGKGVLWEIQTSS